MKIDVSEMRGPLGELFEQCSGENGRARFEEFKLWLKRVTVSTLQLIATIHVCGAKRFVARGAFGKDNPAGIKFYLWDNFRNNLLDKIEENVPETTLAVYTLTKASTDGPIRNELSNEKTTLAYLHELISAQPNGESGLLLTDGKANIFYVLDAKGSLWAVRARWCSGSRGWVVSAGSVTDPDGWLAGCQVFSQVSS